MYSPKLKILGSCRKFRISWNPGTDCESVAMAHRCYWCLH